MLLDIASREEVLALDAKLDRVIALLAQPAAKVAEPLVTLEQAAGHTQFDPRTVRDWTVSGRYDLTGHLVYLPVYEYRNGQLRFKLSDVEAFGLGIGVLTPSLVAGQPPVPTKQAKAPQPNKKKRVPLESQEALKVA
jgi:hypothetical protein